MNYRIAEIFEDTAMGDSGTEIIDIDVQNPISMIAIQQRSTGSGDAITAHLAAVIPKVEIVDGSDRLFSVGGYELDAFDFYHRKRVPFGVNTYLSGVQGIKTYYLNFGRYLWDEVLAFDPTRFKNPQLRITYDKDAGGNASSALELQVVAYMFDEKMITPTGFLMHKEIKKYTLSQGGWEPTPMPTDYPWRMLLIASRYTGKHPHSQFREVKLTEDVDKRVPIHFDTMNLIKWIQSEYPAYVENLYAPAPAAEKTFYITPGYMALFAGCGEVASTISQAAGYGQGGTIALTASAASNIYGQIMGYCPHNAVVVPFGKQDVIEDWYDVARVGSLKLLIKGHASCNEGNIQICLQQLRRY